MIYQSEIVVLVKRSIANSIRKKLAGCGFVTQVNEVSDTPIGEVDNFRIVIYHESFKDFICEKTGYDKTQFVDKL